MKLNEAERLKRLSVKEFSLWESGVEKVCGIDEVGRGPLAGPVVAASVVFIKEKMNALEKFTGLNDSKKVSEKKREKLFEIITQEAEAYSFGFVDETVIDKINIHNASLLAMEKAVKTLKILPDYLLIDGMFKINADFPQEAIIGGDAKCFTIAAASIIAKVTRDKLMKELDKEYPQYGFAVHKGYGTKKHIEAIKKYGRCRIHRKCFGKDF
jgi:ribonuclease HII